MEEQTAWQNISKIYLKYITESHAKLISDSKLPNLGPWPPLTLWVAAVNKKEKKNCNQVPTKTLFLSIPNIVFVFQVLHLGF
jgi:hypothetical protein